MTSLLAPADALAESQRLMTALEQLRAELPFAESILELHRPMHHELEVSRVRSEQAVMAWREALARRWECEIAGRRLYKAVVRQFVQHYGGTSAPEVQLLARDEAGANSSPADLLADLRRLHAALLLGADILVFANRRLPEVGAAADALEQAIEESSLWENRRRAAVLDRRMAQEASRRVRNETRRALAEHFGDRTPVAFGSLFD